MARQSIDAIGSHSLDRSDVSLEMKSRRMNEAQVPNAGATVFERQPPVNAGKISVHENTKNKLYSKI
jgi:hypothetical protein